MRTKETRGRGDVVRGRAYRRRGKEVNSDVHGFVSSSFESVLGIEAVKQASTRLACEMRLSSREKKDNREEDIPSPSCIFFLFFFLEK